MFEFSIHVSSCPMLSIIGGAVPTFAYDCWAEPLDTSGFGGLSKKTEQCV